MEQDIAAAVMQVLHRDNVPLPLKALHHPRYLRELRTEITEDRDGSFLVAVTIPKRGYSTYKRRYPIPKGIPPELDTDRMEAIFALYLPPSIQVVAVRNNLESIIIYTKKGDTEK